MTDQHPSHCQSIFVQLQIPHLAVHFTDGRLRYLGVVVGIHIAFSQAPVPHLEVGHVHVDDAVQQARLPKPVYHALRRTITHGEPLDLSVADAVALKACPSLMVALAMAAATKAGLAHLPAPPVGFVAAAAVSDPDARQQVLEELDLARRLQVVIEEVAGVVLVLSRGKKPSA